MSGVTCHEEPAVNVGPHQPTAGRGEVPGPGPGGGRPGQHLGGGQQAAVAARD